jgi:hypothetical protein
MSTASTRRVRIPRHKAFRHGMPAQSECRVQGNFCEKVSRRSASPFCELAPGCRRKFPHCWRLLRTGHTELLPLRYSGSCGSAHTLVGKPVSYLPIWSIVWQVNSIPSTSKTCAGSAPRTFFGKQSAEQPLDVISFRLPEERNHVFIILPKPRRDCRGESSTAGC